MRLGAHISASGGVFKSFGRADEVGCESFMIYTKSNRMWKAKALTEKDVEKFNEASDEFKHISPVVIHAAYLINLASPKPNVYENSVNALRDEIIRTDMLGIERMVLHPGSHLGEGEDAGIKKIADSLKQVFKETVGAKTRVCLETMAGQGTNIGARFEHLRDIIDQVDMPDRMGVCFDTCHVFTAGYDIRSAESYQQTMSEFYTVVGLPQIKCFHFNDSKHPLGSRKDRHEHIGEGFLGTEAFANFINDPQWKDHPAHLETPKTKTDEDGNEIEMDIVNLNTLRGLVK